MGISGEDQDNGMLPYGKPVVHVEQDFVRQALRIYVGVRGLHGTFYALKQDGTVESFSQTELATAAVEYEPHIVLPDSIARTLMDALAMHFGMVPQSSLLRKDLDAERGRVDKLLDTVSRIAETNSYAAANHPR